MVIEGTFGLRVIPGLFNPAFAYYEDHIPEIYGLGLGLLGVGGVLRKEFGIQGLLGLFALSGTTEKHFGLANIYQ